MATDAQPATWAQLTTEPDTNLRAMLSELHVDVLNARAEIKALEPTLNKLIVEAPQAIRDATANAICELKEVAEAQAAWIEQETLKDRDSFLARQKELNDSFVAEVKELIAAQNATLKRFLIKTVEALRNSEVERLKREAESQAGEMVPAIAPVVVSTAERKRKRWAWGLVGVAAVGGVAATSVGSVALYSKYLHPKSATEIAVAEEMTSQAKTGRAVLAAWSSLDTKAKKAISEAEKGQ